MPFEADVPSWQCFMSPVPPFGQTQVQLAGDTLVINHVAQAGGSCFAAGDPLVLKPMRINLGPLPPGEYQVVYIVMRALRPTMQFNATLVVRAAHATPTLSVYGLLLLAICVAASTGLAARRRQAFRGGG